MIYFIFDLDDTIIVHPPGHEEMYDIRPDPCLINLFNRLPYKSFIFTNGTHGHAELVIEKMQIFSFKKIFSRDTIPCLSFFYLVLLIPTALTHSFLLGMFGSSSEELREQAIREEVKFQLA